MAEQKTISRTPRKYFFDQNNFNDDFVPEPEEPPPPVFSEQELEDARRQAYDKGRREAAAEAAASREKHVAALLETISRNFSKLFEAEQARSAQYETEAIHLCLVMLEKLFPALNERHGLGEIRSVMESVLQGQKGHPEVLIEVHSAYADTIKEQVSGIMQRLHSTCLCTVRANDALGPADCRMSWHNGGAVRDSGSLAGQIREEIEQILADKPRLRDNGEITPEPADA